MGRPSVAHGLQWGEEGKRKETLFSFLEINFPNSFVQDFELLSNLVKNHLSQNKSAAA